MLGNGPVRFGGRPHGKGPAQRAPRRAAHPVPCSASLDELVSDILSVVVTAHALAADILGEFGISEPSILRPDGSLNVQRLNAQRRQTVEPWARARDLVAM